MKKLVAVLALLVPLTMLSACDPTDPNVAAFIKAFNDLKNFTVADLEYAAGLADKATDPFAPYRARCYRTVEKHVPSGETVAQAPDLKGLVTLAEVGFELKYKAQDAFAKAGIPADIVADCGFLAQEALKP